MEQRMLEAKVAPQWCSFKLLICLKILLNRFSSIVNLFVAFNLTSIKKNKSLEVMHLHETIILSGQTQYLNSDEVI